jgi:Transposase zinc-binding domain/Putative transposase
MTLGEIFRLYGNEYIKKFGSKMLPSHKRALNDIAQCRTDILGTVHWYCPECKSEHFSYRPCRNRSCPGCQNDKRVKWLIRQLDMKLPVEYFMATFTIPQYLRTTARSNQKLFYNILFKAASQAIIKLSKDKKYMGGQIGIVGILHTWARNLALHPHVHFLIPGAAISNDKKKILFNKEHFLVYAPSLSKIFRAVFIKLLRESGIEKINYNPAFVKDWVVNVRSVGSGQKAIDGRQIYL